MSVPKIISNCKVNQENNVVERTKILREINKMTCNQFKFLMAAPLQTVPRKKFLRCKHNEGQKHLNYVCRSFMSQATQTDVVAPSEYEGVVRYPSSWRVEIRPKKEVGLQVQQSLVKELWIEPSHTRANPAKVKETGHVVKPKTTSTLKADPCRAPPKYKKGVVPKYLRKINKEECVKKPNSSSCTQIVSDVAEREENLGRLASWHDSHRVSELNMLSAAS